MSDFDEKCMFIALTFIVFALIVTAIYFYNITVPLLFFAFMAIVLRGLYVFIRLMLRGI